MKRNGMMKSIALWLISILAIAGSSEAVLLAYEGFEYTAGETLKGQSASGGFGWTWAADTRYLIQANSLSMPNLPFATQGGSIRGQGDATVGMTAAAHLDFSVDATYYISFLCSREGWEATVNSAEWLDFHLRTAGWSNVGSFGISSGDQFQTAELGGAVRGGDAATTNVVFIVGKIVAHAGDVPDEIYLKAYTENDIFEPTETSFWTITGGTEDIDDKATKVTLKTGGKVGLVASYDELRIGTSWGDVVPITEKKRR